MKFLVRGGLALAALVGAVGVLAGTAGAAPGFFGRGGDHVVFVQTDNPAGNQIVAYDRAANGSLSPAGTYATGGNGGQLAGSVVDHTASQGALAYDAQRGLLYAVNAGSNSVSVFVVRGDRLALVQVVPSGGAFPVSIAVHNDLVYVLNAGNGGSVQGYRELLDHLIGLPGSSRSLGLDPAGTPQFTHTPGQVAFSPDGSKLVVTTKASTNAIDVYQVGFLGYLSPSPVVNVEAGALPFAVAFDQAGNLVVADTGIGSLATYSLNRDGTVTLLHAVATSQAATCWVAPAGGYFYTSNAGSASVTGFSDGPGGALADLGNTAADAGTVDASATSDGQFLYVQAGAAGNVDAFHVNADGSLTAVGSVLVPNAVGAEGIVAI